MSDVECQGVVGEVLSGLDLTLGAGLHVVVGGPADGRDELIRFLSGTARPRRGRVLVGGREPGGDPATRAVIGSVLIDEPGLPSRSTVSAHLEELLAMRGAEHGAAHALDALGLGALGARRARSLDAEERRSVAAALAASLSSPRLLCISEPLSRLAGVGLSAWLSAITLAAERGACVVIATASSDDAARFADEAYSLEHGRIVRRAVLVGSGALPGGGVELVVRAADPRRLVRALAGHADIAAVAWDSRTSPDELHVRGADLTRLSVAILETSRSMQIELRALYPTRTGLESLQAASAAQARAAYEAAYSSSVRSSSPPGGGGTP